MNPRTLICMVGLPYSGKTTWARDQSYPIVNPDSIRLAIHGQRFIPEAERLVWAIAHTMVHALFLAGHQRVILDATNGSRKRRDEWQSDKWDTFFKLIDTSAEICRLRAHEKNDSEIQSVIDRMVAEWQPLAKDELLW